MKRAQPSTSNRTKLTVLASSISAILGTGGMHSAFAQQSQSLDEVVVTGSRIVRRDLQAPTPIMTVDAQRLDNSSTLSVESVLNQMPQFTPAQNQFSAQGEIQTSPTSSLGVGTINLRGTGTNRTLVLIDGRRAQPANAALVVDLNTIPAAAIERVETITGGASAVYGADALAGVVNFVLKDNFEGIAMDAQTMATSAGDGEETRFSSLVGINSDSGKSNLLLGVEWYERRVAYQKNRSFYTNGWHDPSNPLSTFFPSMPGYAVDNNNAPSQATINTLFQNSPNGAPTLGTAGLTFYANHDGSLFARSSTGQTWNFDQSQLNQPDTGDGFYGLVENANGALQQVYVDGPLQSPMTRRSAFAKGHVDITDNLRAFVQANFSRSEVHTFSAGPIPAVGGAWGGSIPNDPANPNTQMPTNLQTLLDSRTDNTANWQLNRGMDFLGNFGPTNSSDAYQIVAGLDGSMKNSDTTWEVYYSSGSTNALNIYYGLPSLQRWHAVVGAPNFGQNLTLASPDGGNYQLSCTSGLPIYYGGTASLSQDCINAILGSTKSETLITQDIFEGNVQGKLLDMKAGELRYAAGATHRRNAFTYEPGNPQSFVFDWPIGIFVSNPTKGSTEVSELYGELSVPVAKKLDLEFGYRYSDYDSAAGKVGTYKALFDYSATNWLRLRGGFQGANRAPNTAELFQAETTFFERTFSSGDPCGVNTTVTWGNVAANPNQLQVQQLCAALIGNTTSDFGAPGSVEANTYLQGQAPFTGINGVQVGNPNLKSEEAKTWTFGFVFQRPDKLPGLTASIDFYNIEIKDAIGTFDGFTIYSKCFNADGVSNPSYSINDPNGFCSLIRRDAGTGARGTVDELYLNTGVIETAGADLAVNWTKDLKNGGSLSLSNQMTYLDYYNTQTTATDPKLEYKGTLGNGGEYDWKLSSTVNYRFSGGNAGVGLRMRYLPEVKNAAYVNDKNTAFLPTKSYSEFDMFASYTFNERYQLRGGIDNLFDTDPAIVGALPNDSNSNQTIAGYYDVLGRRAYVGVKIQF